MISPNIEHLQEHGPTVGSDLPDQQALKRGSDKRHGLTRFELPVPNSSGANSPIYYLWDEHDRPVVVRAWLDTYGDQLKGMDLQEFAKLLRRQGPSWVTKCKAAGVFDEYRDEFGSRREHRSTEE